MSPSGPRRRATITTVATAAGVAPSTVSRAFTNPGRVNHRTREHVLAVAERLGYAPNPAAQALESGRTNTVALVVPDITNPYFSGVIKGAERGAAEAGLTLVLGDTQENPANEEQLVRRLGPAVDGFVLAASRLPGRDPGRGRRPEPAGAGQPRRSRASPAWSPTSTTAPSRSWPTWPPTGTGRSSSSADPAESWCGARRWAGLQTAAAPTSSRRRGSGPTPRPSPPALPRPTPSWPRAARRSWRTTTCWRSACSRGSPSGAWSCREDVSVVGFDDIFGSDFCQPPLTTLAERTRDAGARAIEGLVRQALQPVSAEAPVRVLPTQLVVRASTGPVPVQAGDARS